MCRSVHAEAQGIDTVPPWLESAALHFLSHTHTRAQHMSDGRCACAVACVDAAAQFVCPGALAVTPEGATEGEGVRRAGTAHRAVPRTQTHCPTPRQRRGDRLPERSTRKEKQSRIGRGRARRENEKRGDKGARRPGGAEHVYVPHRKTGEKHGTERVRVAARHAWR